MTSVQHVEVLRIKKTDRESIPDLVVAEEPMEIRLGYGAEENRQQINLAVTMRTPGNDEELCLGFLFGEAIINSLEDVLSVKYCDELGTSENRENVLRVELSPSVEFDQEVLQRNFYATSSCGVCGKAAIEAIEMDCQFLGDIALEVTENLIFELPDKLREAQQVFKYTGGLHASALFNSDGKLLGHREDVGRHNALDKLIGSSLHQKQSLSESILLLSGRISFELVQKAARARIPLIAAVGAPSSLAVDFAESLGITLIGFLGNEKFNIYSHPHRVVNPQS